MNKQEKIWWIFVTLTEVAIVLFWIFGFKGNLVAAQYCLCGAGISAVIALAALGVQKLQERRFCC